MVLVEFYNDFIHFSVRIWDRKEGRIMFLYTHPHGRYELESKDDFQQPSIYFREISGVKISGDRILVTSLAGSLNVLKKVSRGSFIVEK